MELKKKEGKKGGGGETKEEDWKRRGSVMDWSESGNTVWLDFF